MSIRKPFIVAGCSTIGVVAGFFVLLFLSGYPEGYCFFCPSIDTVYADGYSEQQFVKVRVGMTMSEVDQIMCPPLSMWTNKNGGVRVFYTQDGKARFGDFAWFARGLYVSNGIVTEIVSTMYYD